MTRRMPLLLAAFAALFALTPAAPAGWGGVRIGVGVGFPIYPGPCCYRPYYYRPYPIYVAPPPVVVQPVPVYQSVPVVQPVPAAQAPQPGLLPVPAPVATTARSAMPEGREGDIDRYLQQLQHPDPRERTEAVGQLGRLKATGAIAALGATLSNDRDSTVRDAAARALGLIGSQDALAALQRAAQADESRDVRRSASYAAEIIRASLTRP